MKLLIKTILSVLFITLSTSVYSQVKYEPQDTCINNILWQRVRSSVKDVLEYNSILEEKLEITENNLMNKSLQSSVLKKQLDESNKIIARNELTIVSLNRDLQKAREKNKIDLLDKGNLLFLSIVTLTILIVR
jgi:hypothetical protein